jgi:hypothetical protein
MGLAGSTCGKISRVDETGYVKRSDVVILQHGSGEPMMRVDIPCLPLTLVYVLVSNPVLIHATSSLQHRLHCFMYRRHAAR